MQGWAPASTFLEQKKWLKLLMVASLSKTQAHRANDRAVNQKHGNRSVSQEETGVLPVEGLNVMISFMSFCSKPYQTTFVTFEILKGGLQGDSCPYDQYRSRLCISQR